MKHGDHIYVWRPPLNFTHHGIDCGDGTVIHYTGELGEKVNACVRQTSKDEFLKGGEEHVREYGECDSADIVIARAKSRLGEPRYHLAFNNCEHFATWCKTERPVSGQVHKVTAAAVGSAGSGSAVAVGIGIVSASGEVAGLGAAGVMSGLAEVGGLVGGGAVAGVVMVGVAPAALASAAMLGLALRDDPAFHELEREARKAGRVATVIGAVGASASAVGAVAASGSVAGLSAAGITSGLAAVGSVAGGGMVAGVALTAALPALAAAGIGYGTYRIWKALRGATS